MSESGKVVVTKSKLDGLANAINDKAQSPGPKTIAQLTQTVNDMKTEEAVIVKFTGLKDNDSGTLTCDKTYSEIQKLADSTKQILAKVHRDYDEATGLPDADYVLSLGLSGAMDGICFIGGDNGKRLVVYSYNSETWNYVFTRIASIPKTSAILKGSGSGGVSAAVPGTDYMAPIPVTASDNGKFLRVVSGAWAAVEIANANGGSF